MNSPQSLPDDLPLLTEVVGEATGDFPILTKVVGEAARDIPVPAEHIETPPIAPPTEISEQLLQHLQAHLENSFAQKLQQHLAEAQRHAVEQALAELRSELPQLIRAALDTPHDPA